MGSIRGGGSMDIVIEIPSEEEAMGVAVVFVKE